MVDDGDGDGRIREKKGRPWFQASKIEVSEVRITWKEPRWLGLGLEEMVVGGDAARSWV